MLDWTSSEKGMTGTVFEIHICFHLIVCLGLLQSGAARQSIEEVAMHKYGCQNVIMEELVEEHLSVAREVNTTDRIHFFGT